jgi:cation diffusion facilitator family transporter
MAEPERVPSLRRMASLTSLSIAFVLIAVKSWAWLATGSVAMLTSALDALVDAAAAFATFVGVRYAQQPPDRLYRWGYGKAEAIAALMQALFLAGAALALIFQSIERLIRPEQLDELGLGLWIIGLSTIAAAGLVVMQTWVLRKTASTAGRRITQSRSRFINARSPSILLCENGVGASRSTPIAENCTTWRTPRRSQAENNAVTPSTWTARVDS